MWLQSYEVKHILLRNGRRISFATGDLELFPQEVAEDGIGKKVNLTIRPEYVTLDPESGAAGRGAERSS